MIVGLNGSQIGVNYTLWSGITLLTPTPVPGTGGPISFGYQTTGGWLWVLAENTTTGCINRMENCIDIIVIQPLPVSVSINTATTSVPAGQDVTFTATPVNGGSAPSFQWKVNGFNVGADSPTYTYKPVNGDAVTCMVTSSESCASGNPATSNTILMTVSGVSADITVTGNVAGGETKCYNASHTLTVAGGGTSLVVNAGGSATFIAGHNIIFKPGTWVRPGGYMHGYISTTYCVQNGPMLPTVVTGESEQPTVVAENLTFAIYPNPTNGNFTLEQKGSAALKNARVEIYGMRGETVFAGEMKEERKREFSVSDLPAGLYFVKVISGDYIETIKLIKTR